MSARDDLIRIRAYEIWEDHGRPQGCEEQHWAQAKQEIEEAEREAAAQSPSGTGHQPVRAATATSSMS